MNAARMQWKEPLPRGAFPNEIVRKCSTNMSYIFSSFLSFTDNTLRYSFDYVKHRDNLNPAAQQVQQLVPLQVKKRKMRKG